MAHEQALCKTLPYLVRLGVRGDCDDVPNCLTLRSRNQDNCTLNQKKESSLSSIGNLEMSQSFSEGTLEVSLSEQLCLILDFSLNAERSKQDQTCCFVNWTDT